MVGACSSVGTERGSVSYYIIICEVRPLLKGCLSLQSNWLYLLNLVTELTDKI